MTSNQVLTGLKNGALSFEEQCEEFIKINSKIKELKKLEESLKDSIKAQKAGVVGIVYQNDSDTIKQEVVDVKEMDIKTIKKEFNGFNDELFDSCVTISKTAAKEFVVGHYEKSAQSDITKKINSIIELNSTKVGETVKISVYPLK